MRFFAVGFMKTMLVLMLIGITGWNMATAFAQQPANGLPKSSATKGEPRRVHRLGDSVGTEAEWQPGRFNFIDPEAQLDAQLRSAEQMLSRNVLTGNGGKNAVQLFLSVLKQAPDNPRARVGLDAVRSALHSNFSSALKGGDIARAQQSLLGLQEAGLAAKQRVALAQALSLAERVHGLMQSGRAAEAGPDMVEAAKKAVALYRQALSLDSGLVAARQAIADFLHRLIKQAHSDVAAGNYSRAARLAGAVASLEPQNAELAGLNSELLKGRKQHLQDLLSQARTTLRADRWSQALHILQPLQSLKNAELAGLLKQARTLERFDGHRPGERFSDRMADNATGPDLVVLPLGSFLFGANVDDPAYDEKQGAQIHVRVVDPIAIMRTETSRAQFAAFVTATGFVTDAERGAPSTIFDPSTGATRETDKVDWHDNFLGTPGRDDEPVIHVSWNDAKAYAKWMSQQTGHVYRLPSEAEFEFALRGGTHSIFWWGDGAPRELVENLAGTGERFRNKNYWPIGFARYNDRHWGPAPVASFKTNPFGLFDLGGNVAEWTLDCFHTSLQGRPDSALPRLDGKCSGHVIKGGYWSAGPLKAASASRFGLKSGVPDNQVGFRLVRGLAPKSAASVTAAVDRN